MKKNRIWYGILTGFAFFFYVISQKPESLMFFGILFIMPFLSVMLEFIAIRKLKFQIMIWEGCFAGQKIKVHLKLTRKLRLPLGVIQMNLDMKNLMFDEQKDEVITLEPNEKQKMDFCHLVLMEDCGSVRITAVEARCYDLLGLFCFKRTINDTREVLVYPANVHLSLELERRPESKTSGDLYDPYRKGQDVNEMAGLRDYVEGDLLRSIHWKLSEKIDSLVVREFGYPSNYSVLLLYDMMKNCDKNPVSNKRNNAVLALTVALSYSMVENNLEHEVGRMFLGECQKVPIHSIGTHETMLMNVLYQQMIAEGRSGDGIYTFLRGNLKQNYTKIVYITPEYEEEAVRQLAKEMDVTVIQVTEGAKGDWIYNPEYTVIPIDAQSYLEQIHSIVI